MTTTCIIETLYPSRDPTCKLPIIVSNLLEYLASTLDRPARYGQRLSHRPINISPSPRSEKEHEAFQREKAQLYLKREKMFVATGSSDPDWDAPKDWGSITKTRFEERPRKREGALSRSMKVFGGISSFESGGSYCVSRLRSSRITKTIKLGFLSFGTLLKSLELSTTMQRTSQIDFNIVENWIKECISTHTCGEYLGYNGDGLRVIDCHLMCIVNLPSWATHYFALSYVWGQVPAFEMTKAKLPALMKKRALSSEWGQLGKIVEDAISFMRRIRERYLWVDRLCIVQDDLEQKQELLDSMDKIYMNAFAVIIAGSSVDTNAGLPGLRLGSRKTEYQMIDIAQESLAGSVYESRGWTYGIAPFPSAHSLTKA